MRINIEEAYKIVKRRIRDISANSGIEVRIVEEATIEKEYYWVFFYNSNLYLDGNGLSYCLSGNAPLIVDKIKGEVFETGTAHPIEFYMSEFDKVRLPSLLNTKL